MNSAEYKFTFPGKAFHIGDIVCVRIDGIPQKKRGLAAA